MERMLEAVAADGLSLALALATVAVLVVILLARVMMTRDHGRMEAAADPSRLFSGLGRDIALRKSIERRREARQHPSTAA